MIFRKCNIKRGGFIRRLHLSVINMTCWNKKLTAFAHCVLCLCVSYIGWLNATLQLCVYAYVWIRLCARCVSVMFFFFYLECTLSPFSRFDDTVIVSIHPHYVCILQENEWTERKTHTQNITCIFLYNAKNIKTHHTRWSQKLDEFFVRSFVSVYEQDEICEWIKTLCLFPSVVFHSAFLRVHMYSIASSVLFNSFFLLYSTK